jgi:hypothetical protein
VSISCIICQESISETQAKVVISPWIRQLGIKQRTSKFLNCLNCGFGFFSYRYLDEEMNYIYNDYRGKKYVSVRSRWEPWYDLKYNLNHDQEAWVSMRLQILTKFLDKFAMKPNVVVDIGGDRGQYIPNLGQQMSVVIDKSGKELVQGVIRKSSLSEVYEPDLIILSHVLEHVANPIATIEELFSYSNIIYIEVPYGVPLISKKRSSKVRFLVKLASSISPFFWRKYSMPATGKKSGNGVLIQSEHISFFSEVSMMALAKISNSRILLEVNEMTTPDGSMAKVIQCLLFKQN